MDLENILKLRADNQCELCASPENLQVYQIEPIDLAVSECQMLACAKCAAQLSGDVPPDKNHLQCLIKAVDSEYVSVQVVAYRLLQKVSDEEWAKEALKKLNFDDITLQWANARA